MQLSILSCSKLADGHNASRCRRLRLPTSLFWACCLMLGGFSVSGQSIQVPLGYAQQFGLLAGDSIVANTAIHVEGSAGAAGTISTAVATTGLKNSGNAGLVLQALSDLASAKAYCSNLTGSSLTTSLSGQILAAGVYDVNGNAVLSKGSVLKLAGDSAAVYVFNISGSLSLDSFAVIDKGNVCAKNIFWNVGGSTSIATEVVCYGIFLCNGSIYKNGLHFGAASWLANSEISLNWLSAYSGHNSIYSPQNVTESIALHCPEVRLANRPDAIRNGGFETSSPCPTAANQLERACFWRNPTTNTPDYFSTAGLCTGLVPGPDPTTCSALPPVGYHYGCQSSHTPSTWSYAGIRAYSQQYPDHREYIAQNIGTLIPGKKYYGEFYVSLADQCTLRVDELSMYITQTDPNRSGVDANKVFKENGNLVTSTITSGNLWIDNRIGWERISGIYEAPSTAANAESWVVLGNFLDWTRAMGY